MIDTWVLAISFFLTVGIIVFVYEFNIHRVKVKHNKLVESSKEILNHYEKAYGANTVLIKMLQDLFTDEEINNMYLNKKFEMDINKIMENNSLNKDDLKDNLDDSNK